MSRVLGLDGTISPLTGIAARARHRLTTLTFPERALVLSIVLAVVAVFSVGLRNDFVDWDDPANLLDNQDYRGLGRAQLAWMLTTTLMGHYIPLTWLTFGLDYVLWGMEPAGYHFTNLVLHAANATLMYWLAKHLLLVALPRASEYALRAGAAVAALFFAVHPLRAESVAWATERRDVLSGLFFLTCLLTYVRAAGAHGHRQRRLLVLAIAAFTLAMLAKSIVMTLPLLLLVLDWYPLRRLQGWSWSEGNRRVVLEKIPFFVIALAGAEISYWAVARDGLLTQHPLPSRIAMALYSVAFYISKTVLPFDLSPLYEAPSRVDVLDPQFLGASIAVTALSVALVALARRWPAGLAAYAWYAIMLVPVGGLVHAGHQLAHDRYSYLSCLSFAVLAGGAVVWLAAAQADGRLRPPLFRASWAAIGTLLVTLAFLTWMQVQVWRDTESLWMHATSATPECSICHNNYGTLLVNRSASGSWERLLAVEHFQQALMLKPERNKPYGGLGVALLGMKRPREAEQALRRVVAEEPKNIAVLNNLGLALNEQGRFRDAIPFLRRAVALDEHHPVIRANLGHALLGSGRVDEAIGELHRATDEWPFQLEPRKVLVLAYREAGNRVEMRKQLTILGQLHPFAAQDLARKHHLQL
jgi:protein O-mannosyl-transferase